MKIDGGAQMEVVWTTKEITCSVVSVLTIYWAPFLCVFVTLSSLAALFASI